MWNALKTLGRILTGQHDATAVDAREGLTAAADGPTISVATEPTVPDCDTVTVEANFADLRRAMQPRVLHEGHSGYADETYRPKEYPPEGLPPRPGDPRGDQHAIFGTNPWHPDVPEAVRAIVLDPNSVQITHVEAAVTIFDERTGVMIQSPSGGLGYGATIRPVEDIAEPAAAPVFDHPVPQSPPDPSDPSSFHHVAAWCTEHNVVHIRNPGGVLIRSVYPGHLWNSRLAFFDPQATTGAVCTICGLGPKEHPPAEALKLILSGEGPGGTNDPIYMWGQDGPDYAAVRRRNSSVPYLKKRPLGWQDHDVVPGPTWER